MTVKELITELVQFLDEYGNEEVRFAKSYKKGEPFETIEEVDEERMLYADTEDSDFVCLLCAKKRKGDTQ